jgi:hypothetical protein
VIALTERELGELEEVLEAAEAEGSPARARELLLTRVIDMAVARRRAASTLQFDPVVVRLLAEHQPFQRTELLHTMRRVVALRESAGPESAG